MTNAELAMWAVENLRLTIDRPFEGPKRRVGTRITLEVRDELEWLEVASVELDD